MAYATDGSIGVGLATTTAGTTTDGVGALFTLGQKVIGNNGTEWIYVQAGAAITQYDCVLINKSNQAVPITSTLATQASGSSNHTVGFAQVAFADNDFGWVALKGAGISCRGVALASGDVRLFTTATAGVLGTSSAGVLINGVAFVTALVTGDTAEEIIASNPMNRTLTGLST